MRAIVAAFFSLLAVAPAYAADVTITDAKIVGGRLVVTGKTLTANMPLTLDDRFPATSNALKAFTYSLVYLPTDCIVAVNKTGSAVKTQAAVANCAARGLNPQGAWNTTKQYVTDDVVTQLGSVWRAKRDNNAKLPSTNPLDWEKFVSKGDTGATGLRGPQGLQGIQGIQGIQGVKGDKGDQGIQGVPGPSGANIVTKTCSAASCACDAGQTLIVGRVHFSNNNHADISSTNDGNALNISVPVTTDPLPAVTSIVLRCLQP